MCQVEERGRLCVADVAFLMLKLHDSSCFSFVVKKKKNQRKKEEEMEQHPHQAKKQIDTTEVIFTHE